MRGVGWRRQRTRRIVATVGAAVALWTTGCVEPAPTVQPEPVQDLDLPEIRIPASASVERRALELTVRVRTLGCTTFGVGSGFVLRDGVVVTNRHVVEQPVQVTVNTWDGHQLEAEVTGHAADSDLAVLELGHRGGLPVADVRTDPVLPGEPVVVAGYPGGGPVTLSWGTVAGFVDGELLGEPADVIRLDAEIRPGNSGGPVLDQQGRVVGVVFAVEAGRGTGLAVPIATLLERLDAAVFNPPPGC